MVNDGFDVPDYYYTFSVIFHKWKNISRISRQKLKSKIAKDTEAKINLPHYANISPSVLLFH